MVFCPVALKHGIAIMFGSYVMADSLGDNEGVSIHFCPYDSMVCGLTRPRIVYHVSGHREGFVVGAAVVLVELVLFSLHLRIWEPKLGVSILDRAND